MAIRGAGKRMVQAAVDDRTEFRSSSMSARWVDRYTVSFGRLPNEHMHRLQADAYDHGRVFVVYSYNTPIGWTYGACGVWTIPDVHYSATTDNHQSVLRVAVANPGFYADARH